MTGEWQDIATAPKDGTEILVWDGGFQYVAWIGDTHAAPSGDKDWVFGAPGGDYDEFPIVEPTHWTPLPPPPAP